MVGATEKYANQTYLSVILFLYGMGTGFEKS